MVSVADAIGLAIILLLNSIVAALLTRFFRVRLATSWGSLVYVAFVGSIVLLALTLVLGGALGLGPNLGSPAVVVLGVVALPLSLGATFDYFWMPAPEEIEVPDRRAT
ncbi:hypothetical protein [Halapricum hydrolyticum]|uniref:DUF7991 domain-containing protein n=1 Tax=Halapricum hydrolyticum TaxID=2979991 RepID=A0AAE3I9V0_9EURY|nr:hypothetical protein [Halapricum hydrolyticum]MCU4716671.1 hypothetical protein [Halapricum hydrolyticum]MCU4725724.1 hypothetical protein [Halapricum hydrolyticum]